MRWLRLLLVAIAVVVTASACRIDATVEVVATERGTGTVSVRVVADGEAVRLAPDLPGNLRLDDVRDAGWTVVGPESSGGGGMVVEASKGFDSPERLPEILAELAGEGVFEDIELTQSHTEADFSFSFSDPLTTTRTDYDLTARIVPPSDPRVFSDDLLAEILDGHLFGRPELVDEAGGPVDPDSSLGMVFTVTLPYDVASDTAAEIDGNTAEWRFSFGDDAFDVDASSMIEDSAPRMWLALVVLAIVASVLVVLFQLLWWIFSIVRTPKGRRRLATRRRRRRRAAARSTDTGHSRRRLLRLLVVDVHGVVVRPTDPLEGLLLPIVRAELPDIDPEMVRDRHRKLLLGRLTPEEFWSDLGLGPISDEIETRYLSSYRLVPGLHTFLDRMRDRQLPVAVIGNQPRHWGERLRRMAALEDTVASWLVSGDVGATLPESSLFEATRRVMSVDTYDCLYLSSVPDNLDAAAELGLATAYFAASPADAIETSHTMVRGFNDILKGRAGST